MFGSPSTTNGERRTSLSASLKSLVPQVRPYAEHLVNLLRWSGNHVEVTSVHRTRKVQERLYRNWITGRSKLPAAVPGTSKHERDLAFDIVINGKWPAEWVGKLWESWGGRWGGRFRDPVHFEAP